jgi:hypothetical protein
VADSRQSTGRSESEADVVKIYVAGKFEEYEIVREVQKAAVEAGHYVTADWTRFAEEVLVRGRKPDTQYLQECAGHDYWGVKNCHLFIGIHHPDQFGTSVEFGLALAWGKRVWLVGEWEPRQSPFFYVPGIKYGWFSNVNEVKMELKYTAPEGTTPV